MKRPGPGSDDQAQTAALPASTAASSSSSTAPPVAPASCPPKLSSKSGTKDAKEASTNTNPAEEISDKKTCAPRMRRDASLVGKPEGFDAFDPAILGPRSVSLPDLDAPPLMREQSINDRFAYDNQDDDGQGKNVSIEAGDSNLLPTMNDFAGDPDFPHEISNEDKKTSVPPSLVPPPVSRISGMGYPTTPSARDATEAKKPNRDEKIPESSNKKTTARDDSSSKITTSPSKPPSTESSNSKGLKTGKRQRSGDIKTTGHGSTKSNGQGGKTGILESGRPKKMPKRSSKASAESKRADNTENSPSDNSAANALRELERLGIPIIP